MGLIVVNIGYWRAVGGTGKVLVLLLVLDMLQVGYGAGVGGNVNGSL